MRQQPQWFYKIVLKLEAFVERPWAIPCLASLALLDFVILIVPVEGILISTVMLRPKHWWRIAVWFGVGTALGTLLMAYFVELYGVAAVELVMGQALEATAWSKVEAWIQTYGLWAVAGLNWTPLPPQGLVAFAALGKMSLTQIVLAMVVGRLPRYILLAYLASYSPDWLKKWGWVRRETERLVPPHKV